LLDWLRLLIGLTKELTFPHLFVNQWKIGDKLGEAHNNPKRKETIVTASHIVIKVSRNPCEMLDKKVTEERGRETKQISGDKGREIADLDLPIDTDQKNEVEEDTEGKDDGTKVSIGTKHTLPVISQRVAKVSQQGKGQGSNKNKILGHHLSPFNVSNNKLIIV